MAASYTVDGDNVTVSFEYTAPTAVVQDIVGDAAHFVWQEEMDEEGNVTNPFSEATNQEKLDALDEYVKDVIINNANTYKSRAAQEAAREAEEADQHEL